jgi:rubrerythrin
MSKQVLYPHRPGGPPDSMMKTGVPKSEPHISADFKNSISKQIVDEEQAAKDYVVLSNRARNMGLPNEMERLAAIASDERRHKQMLEGISREIAGK